MAVHVRRDREGAPSHSLPAREVRKHAPAPHTSPEALTARCAALAVLEVTSRNQHEVDSAAHRGVCRTIRGGLADRHERIQALGPRCTAGRALRIHAASVASAIARPVAAPRHSGARSTFRGAGQRLGRRLGDAARLRRQIAEGQAAANDAIGGGASGPTNRCGIVTGGGYVRTAVEGHADRKALRDLHERRNARAVARHVGGRAGARP